MDPNEALANVRRWVGAINTAKTQDDLAVCAPDLAEAVEALDEWITKGGFLPRDWSFKLAVEHHQRSGGRTEFVVPETARRRMETAIDRAFRDDEEVDRALLKDDQGGLRERLTRVAAEAIAEELVEESRQAERAAVRYAMDHMARTVAEVGRVAHLRDGDRS